MKITNYFQCSNQRLKQMRKIYSILAILFLMLFLIGCAQKAADDTTQVTEETGAGETDIAEDISEVDTLEEDLDMTELDNLEKDLDAIDWEE